MERQPAEAVRNNALATASLARICQDEGVGHFVLISTDKAVAPTSAMGASKRLAEKAVLAAQQAAGNQTRFSVVRFGNVLGSSGSVVPLFTHQIARGGPVTVTDPEITRYFMTIPEAVGLVLFSAALAGGGDTFLLDMGESIKIDLLARRMISLSGFVPDRDIQIVYTGLRPGEKLYEELNHADEPLEPTRHPRIRRVQAPLPDPQCVQSVLEDLKGAQAESASDYKRRLQSHLPDYVPDFG